MKPAAEITLRPTSAADLGFVLDAERSPENSPFIRRWTLEQHLAAIHDPDVAHRMVQATGSSAPSGFVLLTGLTNPHLGVEFKRIVVTLKGAGIGRAAVRAVKAWAFLEHGAHRLWLEVKPFNARARALYASEGFREEGTLRDCIRSGDGWESLIVMSMLSPEHHPGAGPGTVGGP